MAVMKEREGRLVLVMLGRHRYSKGECGRRNWREVLEKCQGVLYVHTVRSMYAYIPLSGGVGTGPGGAIRADQATAFLPQSLVDSHSPPKLLLPHTRTLRLTSMGYQV